MAVELRSLEPSLGCQRSWSRQSASLQRCPCRLVDTPFFDDPKPDGLRPEDIARTVLFAVQSPPTVDVHELLVYPTPKKTEAR